jgi:response regulator RpfG family c-di-GMP phosphodiesterase/DNA-binding NarL/FixJ family response regulator
VSKRLGERLLEAGVVAASAVDQALAHQKITGHRLGDCLVELGLLDEGVLLRFLASEFKTRFVSADKLAKAKIGAQVLDRVPVRMCEAQDFLPLAYDAERKLLSVVMAEPQNESLIREITLVTEMAEVFAYVGMRSAIQAGIRKHYYSDPTAFAALEQGGQAALRADVSKVANAYESADVRPGTRSSSAAGRTGSRNLTQLKEALGGFRGSVSESDYLETLTLLVTLLEQAKGAFRGHSAQVARQAGLIGRRLGLSPREVAHTTMASTLHELGKSLEPHLTLLGISESDDARVEAKRQLRVPIKLFESVHLPGAVNGILAQLYEAFDGSGLPHGAQGQDISISSRIIAAVDAFLELTKNPLNPFNRLMPKEEALSLLQAKAGMLFDPVVVDTLVSLQSGDLLRQRLLNRGRQVFLADSDEGLRTDLLEAISRRGLVVHAMAKLDGIVDAVQTGEADTVAVGLGYGVNDLVALTQFVRGRAASAGLPLLVFGEPTDQPSKERLVQAGITGFIATPVDPELAASRLHGAFVDAFENGGPTHLVRGSFDEFSAADLLQLFSDGKFSGRLSVRHGTTEGTAHIEQGRLIYASWAKTKGQPALRPLFSAEHAEFQYEADAVSTSMPNLDVDLAVLVRQLGTP